MADVLVRVEYYHDLEPESPSAFETFMFRMANFQKEYEIWKGGCVLDSLTFLELAARNREMYVLNPFPGGGSPYAKGASFDTRQWHAGGTTAVEGTVVTRFSSIPTNLVVCAHVHERQNELNGEILRGPWAPGRLANRGLLCAAFQEQYVAFTQRNEKGERMFALQTQNDGYMAATSQIDAPHPCYPDYESIWANWKGERKPVHVLVYSETGTGKSSFAATFRKAGNLLVWSFDPMGKETPYLKGAKSVSDLQTYELAGQFGAVPIRYRDAIFG